MAGKSQAEVMYPQGGDDDHDNSPTQQALNHLAARYDQVKSGNGPRPSKDEIDAWESIGQHVDKLKKAYADSAKRGLEPAGEK